MSKITAPKIRNANSVSLFKAGRMFLNKYQPIKTAEISKAKPIIIGRI